MDENFQTAHIDILDVEARARRLRAEALRTGIRSIRRWVAGPFHREERVNL